MSIKSMFCTPSLTLTIMDGPLAAYAIAMFCRVVAEAATSPAPSPSLVLDARQADSEV